MTFERGSYDSDVAHLNEINRQTSSRNNKREEKVEIRKKTIGDR
jgi:hypothetical protein